MQIDEALLAIRNFPITTAPKENVKHLKENIYLKDVFIALLELFEHVDEVYNKGISSVSQLYLYFKIMV